MVVELYDAAEECAGGGGVVQHLQRLAGRTQRVRKVHQRGVHRAVREAPTRRPGQGVRAGVAGVLLVVVVVGVVMVVVVVILVGGVGELCLWGAYSQGRRRRGRRLYPDAWMAKGDGGVR